MSRRSPSLPVTAAVLGVEFVDRTKAGLVVVVVRPDRIIYGGAATGGIDALTAELAREMFARSATSAT